MGVRIRVVLLGLSTLSCASARLVLESPIAEQCTSVGLEACPALTEGVLLYVEGDQQGARPKLAEAAKANAPGKMNEFATGLEVLSKVPGAGAYVEPVRQIVTMLNEMAKEREREEAAKLAKTAGAKDAEKTRAKVKPAPIAQLDGPAVMVVDLDEPVAAAPARPLPVVTETGTVVPAVENGAELCQVGAFVSTLSPLQGLCLKAVSGPFTVTDLHMSGSCQSDLYVVGSSAEGARWLVHSPAKTPLHVTGARLLLRANESLAMAISAKARPDVRCAVTWSGTRP